MIKGDVNAAEQPAANGQIVQVGGSVRTGAKSSVALNLSEGTLIRMKEGSAFTLTALNQTGQQIVRRNLNVQPTLTIRPGFPVRVIVNRDLVLAPYPSCGGMPCPS